MKRMDEVFELPLQTIFTGQGFHVKTNPTCSPELETDCLVNAWAAAHAINHVDELADALEMLLKELDSTYIGSANLSDRIHDADAALAAYRGDK